MAKRRVRHAPIDVRHRREWRVHQNHARRDAGVEMIVDLRRVEAGDGDARERGDRATPRGSRPARSAPASRRRVRRGWRAARCRPKARARDRPGVMAAAVHAARPSGIGVENCWSAWLSSERRVWVGRRLAIFASIGSAGGRRRRLCGKARCRICEGTGPSPPRRRHRRSSNPRRRPHRRRRRRPPSRRAGCRRRCGVRVRDRGEEAARPERWRRTLARAMARPSGRPRSRRGFVMKRTSGERERAEPAGALSRPDRLKPVPAGLSLSLASRQSPAENL